MSRDYDEKELGTYQEDEASIKEQDYRRRKGARGCLGRLIRLVIGLVVFFYLIFGVVSFHFPYAESGLMSMIRGTGQAIGTAVHDAVSGPYTLEHFRDVARNCGQSIAEAVRSGFESVEDETEAEDSAAQTVPETTPAPTEAPLSPAPALTPRPTATPEPDNIRDEVRTFVDEYEAFMNEYARFLREMDRGSNAWLRDYQSLMRRYHEWQDKLEALDQSDWTPEEIDYYIQAQSRVSALLGEG